MDFKEKSNGHNVSLVHPELDLNQPALTDSLNVKDNIDTSSLNISDTHVENKISENKPGSLEFTGNEIKNSLNEGKENNLTSNTMHTYA